MKNFGRFVLLFATAIMLEVAPVHAALTVADPRCEGVSDPEQLNTGSPRFSWRLDSAARDVWQTAYQVRITEVDGAGNRLGVPVETTRIASADSQWVSIPQFQAKPRSAYRWQVRVWDNQGGASEWSAPQPFGTGLLGAPWPADFIGDGRALALHETAPARYFRRTFQVQHKPIRARLYLSAQGLVEPWLNGKRVTEDLFVPGFPDYRQRLFYVAYDVTSLLQAGDNTIGMILGDGWYSGTIIPSFQFGPQPTCTAFLDLTDADGTVKTIVTDKDWQWTDSGPIRMNSIYDGETYDARRELGGWCTSQSTAEDWRPVVVRPGRRTALAATGRISPPVRRIETIKPVSQREVAPGVTQYDLGQNMVGWIKLRVHAPAGREVQVRFAEMLDKNGRIYTANLRTAKATLRYIAKGEGIEEFEPHFTYFGFRYVEVSGTDATLPDAITGVVIHTDLPRTGAFTCSDPLLNQLYHNALWSQKGNFLELPTDCPQRDERVGWMGDAQIFAPTALYNLDAGAFYRQWLYSVRDGLRDDPNGGFSDVSPVTAFGHGNPGWAEAGIIVPWTVWLYTGDKQLLAENLPAVQHAVELMAAQSPDGIRHCFSSYNDWLAPGYAPAKAPPRSELIATAYYAHALDLAARMAEALGRTELAASNRALLARAREAYQRTFITPEGRMVDDVQTAYLLTLGFDLASPQQKAQLTNNLLRTITEKDNHLATGFLGTPLLTPVLTKLGHADVAYTVLEQTSYPGWLFTVKNGATTIWERWDSWTPDQGFNPNGMNSFNHYAYGSVVGWFYDTIAGLRAVPESPGWKHFQIAPRPGGGLTSAKAAVETPYGKAASEWTVESGGVRLTVTIPANTTATVVLPTTDAASARLDGQPLPKSAVRAVGDLPGTSLDLPSGTYAFTFSL